MQNNSGNWDRSVLRDVTVTHCESLADADASGVATGASLVNPSSPSKTMTAALAETIGAFDFAGWKTSCVAIATPLETVAVGYVVKIGRHIAEMILHATDASHAVISVVRMWTILDTTRRSIKAKRSDQHVAIATGDIDVALCWGGSLDETVTVLRPLHCEPA